MSVARIAGVLYAVLGFLIGCGISLATMMGADMTPETPGMAMLPSVGAAAVFVLPLVYGFAGFITTLVGAAIFNLLAGVLGGIEIETR